jgi:hypothetical protein
VQAAACSAVRNVLATLASNEARSLKATSMMAQSPEIFSTPVASISLRRASTAFWAASSSALARA